MEQRIKRNTYLNHIRNNNLLIKIITCFLGFMLWNSIGQYIRTKKTITVPIYMYNKGGAFSYASPSHVSLTLTGTRSSLKEIHEQNIGIHIDVDSLTPGKHIVPLTETIMLLPEETTLLYTSPSHVIITV